MSVCVTHAQSAPEIAFPNFDEGKSKGHHSYVNSSLEREIKEISTKPADTAVSFRWIDALAVPQWAGRLVRCRCSYGEHWHNITDATHLIIIHFVCKWLNHNFFSVNKSPLANGIKSNNTPLSVIKRMIILELSVKRIRSLEMIIWWAEKKCFVLILKNSISISGFDEVDSFGLWMFDQKWH